MEKEIKNIIYIYIISNSTRSMDRGLSQNRENHISATAHDQWIVDFLKTGKIMQFTH